MSLDSDTVGDGPGVELGVLAQRAAAGGQPLCQGREAGRARPGAGDRPAALPEWLLLHAQGYLTLGS